MLIYAFIFFNEKELIELRVKYLNSIVDFFVVVEAVKRKFEAFAHKEYNNEEFINEKHIVNCQKTGEDLFKRGVPSRKIKKSYFPKVLLDLMEQNSTFYFASNT